jgi:hypothetical protein
MPILLRNKNRLHLDIVAAGRVFPTFGESWRMLLTFILTVIAWIFFRSSNLTQALDIIASIFSDSFIQPLQLFPKEPLILILSFMIIEWFGREQHYGLEKIGFRWPSFLRLSFYYLLAILVFVYGGKEQSFIYFQF